MITLQPEVLRPYVRVASRHSVEKGEHWKRTLYDFQLILVKQGRIILHQNDHLFKASSNQLLLLWPGLPHNLEVTESGFMSTVHFDPISGANYGDGFYRFPSGQPSEFTPDEPKLMEHLFDALWKSFKDYGPRHKLVMSHIMASILCSLLKSPDEPQHRQHQHKMSSVLTFIRDNLSERIDRHDLSKELGVTPQHVNFLIKKHFNTNVSALIHRERAIAAHHLLSEGMSVGDAGRSVGYDDPFIFSREFKKHMGVAPRYAIGNSKGTPSKKLSPQVKSFFPQD